MDDIPEASRSQSQSDRSSWRVPGLVLGGLVGLGAIALLLGVFLRYSIESDSASTATPPPAEPTPEVESSQNEDVENILGHLPYEEAPQSELKAVTPDGWIRLRSAAADKFRQMQADAQSQGIILTPLSGFRSKVQQNELFFNVKEERVQETSQRAEVSAPPGYSEHHTGYAIDIGDGRAPGTNLNTDFEKTAAFGWLEKNAPRYSFELSFPRDNSQGISYEPWHWRFVGDSNSLKTFYKASQLKQTPPDQPKSDNPPSN